MKGGGVSTLWCAQREGMGVPVPVSADRNWGLVVDVFVGAKLCTCESVLNS